MHGNGGLASSVGSISYGRRKDFPGDAPSVELGQNENRTWRSTRRSSVGDRRDLLPGEIDCPNLDELTSPTGAARLLQTPSAIEGYTGAMRP
jgi:hypothetical protein